MNVSVSVSVSIFFFCLSSKKKSQTPTTVVRVDVSRDVVMIGTQLPAFEATDELKESAKVSDEFLRTSTLAGT